MTLVSNQVGIKEDIKATYVAELGQYSIKRIKADTTPFCDVCYLPHIQMSSSPSSYVCSIHYSASLVTCLRRY